MFLHSFADATKDDAPALCRIISTPPADSWAGACVREFLDSIFCNTVSHRLDAGCDDEEILQHCREQECVHTKGCWVLDLLLG
jgi:hypothetical protein